jgi:hypothetical protein
MMSEIVIIVREDMNEATRSLEAFSEQPRSCAQTLPYLSLQCSSHYMCQFISAAFLLDRRFFVRFFVLSHRICPTSCAFRRPFGRPCWDGPLRIRLRFAGMGAGFIEFTHGLARLQQKMINARSWKVEYCCGSKTSEHQYQMLSKGS